jgi:SAM-dependent methyltransferase
MADQSIVQQMEGYYRERAQIYDDSMGYNSPVVWARYEKLIELLRNNLAGRDVLEIACGPGRWSQTVSEFVRSLVATDVNETVLAEAADKTYAHDRVHFQQTDAYTLQGIEGRFTGAFSVDWWSHMPKSRIAEFLQALHSKMSSGARIVVIDTLCVTRKWRGLRRVIGVSQPWVRARKQLRYDEHGDLLQKRQRPDGSELEIIKNFPTRDELLAAVEGVAKDVEYTEYLPTRRWVLAYTLR